MSVRKKKRAEARQRILEAAARAIRASGPDGVSVAEVMADAGLTHGAFYSYFPSKDALIAAATREAGEHFWGRLQAATAGTKGLERLHTMAAAYLSLDHRAHPSEGCQIAALGPELARAGGPVAQSLEEGVHHVIADLENTLSDALGASAERAEEAAADFATVVGGMVLARAIADDAAAERVLAACRKELRLRAEARRAAGGAAHGASAGAQAKPLAQ